MVLEHTVGPVRGEEEGPHSLRWGCRVSLATAVFKLQQRGGFQLLECVCVRNA
jgi:hypothetical protein